MARDITIRVSVEGTDQAKRQLGDVEQGVRGVEKESETLSGTLKAQAQIYGTVAAGIGLVGKAFSLTTEFIGASVRSFADAEQGLVRLRAALVAQGTATPAVISQYEALALQFQRTTTFSDDLIAEMQALLAQVGNVMPKQMGVALKAATDLSAGLGIDLRTATLLVGKAFAGETGTLSRYGIQIDQAKFKTQGATVVLDAIHQRFGGQAQAQLTTYTGKVTQLSNSWDNVKESVGRVILQDPVLNIMLRSVSELLDTVSGSANRTAGVFDKLKAANDRFVQALFPGIGHLRTWIKVINESGMSIQGFAKAVYETVQLYLVEKFAAVVNAIGQKVQAITGFFKDMYDKVVGKSYVPDMVNGIGEQFSRLGTVMVTPAQAAADAVSALFGQLHKTVMGTLQPMLNDVQGMFSSHFGGGGFLSTLMNTGLSSLFGPGGIVASLVGQGLQSLGDLVWKGLKKIGGFFKDLFGGPSAKELAGREIVAEFERNIAQMLTAAQALEAGNESWKQTVIVVRDAYLALGKTEAEALAAVKRLWESSKGGADAVRAAMEPIENALRGIRNEAAHIPQNPFAGWEIPPIEYPEPGSYHQGGMIRPNVLPFLPRAHRGLAVDEVPIIAQTGEGVLSRTGMRALGGSGRLAQLNAGQRMSGSQINVTVNVDGYVDSPHAQRRLSTLVGEDVMRRLRSRRA